jgi:SAM-dependent methyltransferase
LWDLGKPTPVLADEVSRALAAGRVSVASAVLIPGCGASYDVRALADMGFLRVVGVDIVEEAVARARAVVGGAPGAELLRADFFSDERLAVGSFAFIFDYTFFCALPPTLRAAWGARTAALLAPGGRLLTLAFPLATEVAAADDPAAAGPPFPVSIEAYRRVLEPHGVTVEDGPRNNSLSVRAAEQVVWWCKK